MIDVNKYIKEILKYEENVIIQGLGAFITKYKTAEITDKQGKITPPTKTILFDDKIKMDNGRLLNFIKKTERFQEEEIRNAITEFANRTLQKLDAGEHVRIDELGYLYKDKAYKIQFVQDASENILLDTYGMEDIEWEVNKEEEKKYPVVNKNNNRKNKKIIIPIAILVVLILVLSISISDKIEKEQGSTSTGSIIGGIFTKEANSTDTEAIIKDIDSITEKKNALNYQEDKFAGYSKFYIIAGSFSIYNNAELYKDELVKKGLKAEVLEVDGKIFRVSMKTLTDHDEARYERDRLQKIYKDRTLWILSSN